MLVFSYMHAHMQSMFSDWSFSAPVFLLFGFILPHSAIPCICVPLRSMCQVIALVEGTPSGQDHPRPALNDVDWFVSPVRFLIDRSHAITCKADMNQHVVFKNRGVRARMLLALTSWSIFLVFATLACPPLPFCPVQEMKENLPPRAPTACSGVAEHLAHQASVPTPAPCNHHYFVRHPLACCGKQPIHGRWGNLSRVAKWLFMAKLNHTHLQTCCLACLPVGPQHLRYVVPPGSLHTCGVQRPHNRCASRSETLTHAWHTMVTNHLYRPSRGQSTNDFLRNCDRFRHLEEKEKAAKKLQREAAKEHKKNEKIRKARQQLRNPAGSQSI